MKQEEPGQGQLQNDDGMKKARADWSSQHCSIRGGHRSVLLSNNSSASKTTEKQTSSVDTESRRSQEKYPAGPGRS
jgi:hypothetical protein